MAFEALASRRQVSDGELLLELDRPNGCLYVIESGGVLIERDGPRGPIRVAELGPGESFGEMSFIDHGPASARARAQGETHLIELSHEMLEELLEDHAELWGKVWRNVARILKGRLVQANALLERQVAAQDPDRRNGPLRG